MRNNIGKYIKKLRAPIGDALSFISTALSAG